MRASKRFTTTDAARIIAALGQDIGNGDPPELRELAELAHTLAGALSVAVEGIRRSGYTDAEIAAALGVTRQTVRNRWPSAGRPTGAAAWRRRG